MVTTKKRGRAAGDDAYARRLEDLKAATRVIGDTAAARLAWVAGFVREDPKDWRSATVAEHGDCLVAIGRHGFPPNLRGGVDLPPALTADEVKALHADLRSILRNLVNRGSTTIPTEGRTEMLIRASGLGVKPAIFATSHGDVSPRTAICQAVKDLVLRAGDLLLACPVCGGPFMAIRKQLFCDTKCAQRFRNEVKAGKRKSAEKREDYYAMLRKEGV